MMKVSNRVEALVRLDPAHLDPDLDGRSLTHPAERYRRQPWPASNVVPFPASVNLPALARIATEIVSGRRPGGIESAIMRRARDLHVSHVPVAVARKEVADYAASLKAFIDAAAQETTHGR